MEADVLALRPHQHLFHLPIDALRIQRSVFFYRRGEHPPRLRLLLQLPQHGQHRQWQNHNPVGAFRLRRRLVQSTCHVDHLPLNMELAGAQIQIVPLQRAELTAPHAGRQLQQHHLVEAVLLRLDQKPLHLLVGEHLHLLRFLREQRRQLLFVLQDQPAQVPQAAVLLHARSPGVTFPYHSSSRIFILYLRIARGRLRVGHSRHKVALGFHLLRHLQRVLDDQQLDIRPIVVFLRYAVDHDFLHNGPMIPPTPYFAPPPSPRYSSSMFIRAISAPPLQHKHIPQRRTKVQRKNNNTLALILSMTI